MTDLDSTNPFYVSSVKLCAAIKKYKCLHDQNSYHKYAPPECEAAWQLVAKECHETIEYCKSRWKTLRRCFFQGINRRGNRYYLHEHLEFLLEGSKKKTKRNIEPTLNYQRNSTISDSLQQNFDDGLSLQENEMVTINLYDDDDNKSVSSQTTSADESNEIIKQTDDMGVFIINEIEEDQDCGNDKRLNYKRSCKRPLDPELINELAEEEPEEKRLRKIEKRKSVANDSEKHNFTSQLTNKPLKIKIDKLKINAKETNKCKMIDRFTCTDDRQTRDFATQYEMGFPDFDDIFMQSIKTQLQQMNGRQKMNFKRKIYQSMLEVFDDNADFPSSDEIIQLPPKKPPRVVNTTIGEMRLMRELVTLVQAAKSTPEIMNAKEKVKTSTPIQNKSPLKMPVTTVDNRPKAQTSPISLSPTLDDDDLQYTIDHIDDDDDAPLPRSWEEIKTKAAEPPRKATSGDNVLGLPRHVLQKMVSVAGSSGSTIVARDGDKKRIYRIYPKSPNPNGNHVVPTKNDSAVNSFYASSAKNLQDAKNGSSVGTFVISKNPHDSASRTIKINNSASNTTVRTFSSKPTNSANDTTNSVNKSTQPTSSNTTYNSTNGQTIFKNVHPANRILSSTTGLFKMVSSPRSITPTQVVQKPSTVTSTAGTSSSTVTRVMATKLPMRPPAPDITNKPPHLVSRPGSQIMQRRYSICGPLPAEKLNHSSPNSAPAPKSVVSTNNSNPQTPSSISKIKISQAVSLNTMASNTQTPVSTQTILLSSYARTPSASTTAPQPSKESISTKEAVTSATDAVISTTSSNEPHEIPILETAGTVEADVLDPLFYKQSHIKSEPTDE